MSGEQNDEHPPGTGYRVIDFFHADNTRPGGNSSHDNLVVRLLKPIL